MTEPRPPLTAERFLEMTQEASDLYWDRVWLEDDSAWNPPNPLEYEEHEDAFTDADDNGD